MKKTKKLSQAPEHLSERAAKLWQQYAETIVKSPGGIAMLQTGLEALDRAEQARKLIEIEGMITKTGKSGVSHVHPAISIEKDARSLSLKTFKALNIHLDYSWKS